MKKGRFTGIKQLPQGHPTRKWFIFYQVLTQFLVFYAGNDKESLFPWHPPDGPKEDKKEEEPVNTKGVVLLLTEWSVGVDRGGRRGHTAPRSQVSQTKVPHTAPQWQTGDSVQAFTSNRWWSCPTVPIFVAFTANFSKEKLGEQRVCFVKSIWIPSKGIREVPPQVAGWWHRVPTIQKLIHLKLFPLAFILITSFNPILVFPWFP